MTLFRRSRLPSPPPAAEAMPPHPPECRPPAPTPRWNGAWRSNGALNPTYDPCGSGPMAVTGSKSNGARA